MIKIGGVTIRKEHLKGIINELKKRYEDIPLSKLSNKVWEDYDFNEIVIYGNLLLGKGIKLNLKSEGFNKRMFGLGKKL